MLHEFRTGLNRYLQGRTGVAVKSLADVIRWNRRHASAEMPYFRQELLERSEATRRSKPAAYLEARERAVRLARTDGINRVMREQRIRPVAPSGARAWVTATGTQRRHTDVGGGGLPIISVPAGSAFDLPPPRTFGGVGGRLLRFAYAFEQMTNAASRQDSCQLKPADDDCSAEGWTTNRA